MSYWVVDLELEAQDRVYKSPWDPPLAEGRYMFSTHGALLSVQYFLKIRTSSRDLPDSLLIPSIDKEKKDWSALAPYLGEVFDLQLYRDRGDQRTPLVDLFWWHKTETEVISDLCRSSGYRRELLALFLGHHFAMPKKRLERLMRAVSAASRLL